MPVLWEGQGTGGGHVDCSLSPGWGAMGRLRWGWELWGPNSPDPLLPAEPVQAPRSEEMRFCLCPFFMMALANKRYSIPYSNKFQWRETETFLCHFLSPILFHKHKCWIDSFCYFFKCTKRSPQGWKVQRTHPRPHSKRLSGTASPCGTNTNGLPASRDLREGKVPQGHKTQVS